MQPTGERYLSYTSDPKDSYEHWHRYFFASRFVEDKTVLDIACGEGYGAYTLSRKAKNVTGVDIDQESIEFAKKKYPHEKINFLIGSMTAIPIKGNHIFDVIVSNESIEHISRISRQSFFMSIILPLGWMQ